MGLSGAWRNKNLKKYTKHAEVFSDMFHLEKTHIPTQECGNTQTVQISEDFYQSFADYLVNDLEEYISLKT
jgi:hypothetical protein